MLRSLMKKHCATTLGIGFMAVLAGCASTSEEPESPTARQAMRFGVKIDESRAIVSNATLNADGASFSVWSTFSRNDEEQSVAPLLLFDGETVTRSGGTWSYANTQYWFPKFDYQFQAIYPAGMEGVNTSFDTNTGNLSLKNFDTTKGTDLMAAATTVSAAETEKYENPDVTPAPVNMEFKHLLSRITFSGHSDENLHGTGRKLIVTEVKVGGFRTTGDVELSTNADGIQSATWTLSEPDENSVVTLTPTDGIELSYEGTDLFTGDNAILVAPQSIPANAYIEITYKYNLEAEYIHKAKANLRVSGLTRWEAGKSYRYPFTFNDAVFFDLPTVDPWSSSPINGRPGFNVDIDNN